MVLAILSGVESLSWATLFKMISMDYFALLDSQIYKLDR